MVERCWWLDCRRFWAVIIASIGWVWNVILFSKKCDYDIDLERHIPVRFFWLMDTEKVNFCVTNAANSGSICSNSAPEDPYWFLLAERIREITGLLIICLATLPKRVNSAVAVPSVPMRDRPYLHKILGSVNFWIPLSIFYHHACKRRLPNKKGMQGTSNNLNA